MSEGAYGRVVLRVEADARALVWEVPPGWLALSSASIGGGLVRPAWVTNLGVGDGFDRIDLAAYAAERAAELGLPTSGAGTAGASDGHGTAGASDGQGTTLLTAADVRQVESAASGGVQAWATVGVTKPTWAVAPQGRSGGDDAVPPPGTINIVVALPVALSASALVQAVGTVTEAKAQALLAGGVPGTGTASDAVVVLCPPPVGDPQDGQLAGVPFAGVRSPWGQHVARAVHDAVAAGLAAHPWPPDDVDPAVVW